MNNGEIVSLVEEYINGDTEEFDWGYFEELLAGAEPYYRNLVERLIRFYDAYLDDNQEITEYLSAH